MKKIISIFAITFLFASCAKEIVPQSQQEYSVKSEFVTFNAILPTHDVKTVTDLNNITTWVTGDIITVTDNSTGISYEYKVKEGGSSTAEFEPVNPGSALPLDSQTYDLSAVYAGGVYAEQTNAEGRTSAAPLSATFIGAAIDGSISLTFGQDASLITFSFVDASNEKAPLTLSQLVIESVGGEEIAEGSTSITVTPSEDATSTYQAVVSKVALSKGLLIKATTAENAAAASDGTEFPSGTEFCKIIKQGGADLSDGVHAIVTVLLNQQGISSKADLVSFGYMLEHKLSVSNYVGGTYTNGGHDTPEISVLADIDMGGTADKAIDWHPIGEFCSEDETMRYYFNGHNHNIYNFNVITDASYFGLFGDVYDVTYWGGQIVNLNLGTKDGENWDEVSKITFESDGNGDHYIGTFIGRVKKNGNSNGNWQIQNCKNFVPIEISENNWDKAYVGGFVGNASRVLFKNSKNYGDITNNSPKSGICIGGFAGVVWDKLTQKFDSCDNYGDITVNNKGTSYVGGFVSRYTPANPSSSNVNTFTKCKNYGDITVNVVSEKIRVGGIVGDVIANETYSANFENCENNGAVTVKCDGSFSAADLISTGGIVGRGEAPVTYTSCINTKKVSVELSNNNNKAGVRVGGIYGDNTDKDNDCTECVNSGKVEVQYVTANATSVENYCVGGIAGRISTCADGQDGSSLVDCINEGDLYVKGNRATMGGIVGAMADGSVIGCTNKNEVYAKYNKSTKRQIIVGGIAGDAWGAAKEITNCTNEGLVFAKTLTNSQAQGTLVGGIVGWTESDAETFVISGCENKGEVIGNTCTDNAACAPFVGGIIGLKECLNTDFDNVNRGNVTALATNSTRHAAAGGVVGVLHYGTIESCWNFGTIEAGEKSSAFNDANATYNNGRAGSIAGWYYTSADGPYPACEGTITKCYVGGAVKAKHTSGELVTITSENFGSNIVGRGDDPTDCYFAGEE